MVNPVISPISKPRVFIETSSFPPPMSLLIVVIFTFESIVHRFLSNFVIVVFSIILFRELDASWLINLLVFFLAIIMIKLLEFKEKLICSRFYKYFAPIIYGLSTSFLFIFVITLNNGTMHYVEYGGAGTIFGKDTPEVLEKSIMTWLTEDLLNMHESKFVV